MRETRGEPGVRAGCPAGRLVVDRPQVRLADRRWAEHRHRGQSSFPVGARHALADDLHFLGVEPAREQLVALKSGHEPIQNLVGFLVADSEVPFVRLTDDEVRGRWLVRSPRARPSDAPAPTPAF